MCVRIVVKAIIHSTSAWDYDQDKSVRSWRIFLGMTGTQMPFEQSSQLFEVLTLVSLSDHSFAKATQAMGDEVQVQETE